MSTTTDPRVALYQCALGVAKDAIEAFTDPEVRMPADTGEFKDLKTALVAIRIVYPLCDEFRPTATLLTEIDQLKVLNAELAEALMGVIGWIPGRAAWQTDGPAKAVECARAALEKNRGEPA